MALAATAALSTLAVGAAQASPIFAGGYGAPAGAGDSIDPQNSYSVINHSSTGSPVTFVFNASSQDPGARTTSILSFAQVMAETTTSWPPGPATRSTRSKP